MVGSAAGQRQSLWMRRRIREGEKQVKKEEEKKEKEEENRPKENKEGENEEEKAAGTEVYRCIAGVELEEKKTDFDSRKEKRDDKTLAEKQKSEIQSLDEGGKSRKSHSGEVGKFGNKSVLTKADKSNDGEEEEEEKERKKEKEEEEEGGVGISLALAIASRSVWPHLTG